MPSVLENQERWSGHPWEREGHEWSPGGTAAGGEMLWWRGLLPRIHAHLPAGSVLEIGPGFGRWTQHLLGASAHLTIVDLTARCIEHCRRRFAAYPHLECWTNDGETLDMVEDGTLDFVFSFDSLVHAEAPVLRAYLAQLARKLKPGGTGFIHHSNLGAFATADGRIPAWIVRRNWRGESMSARLFREYCDEVGLHCRSQEIINWVSRSRRADRHRIPGWGMPMTDAMSTFVRPLGDVRAFTRVYVNPRFVEEWRQMVDLASIYGRYAPSRNGEINPIPGTARLQRVLRSDGIVGIVGRIRDRAANAGEHVSSLVRERALARRVRRHEPILGNLRRGRCPDCSGSLRDWSCPECRVHYMF